MIQYVVFLCDMINGKATCNTLVAIIGRSRPPQMMREYAHSGLSRLQYLFNEPLNQGLG